MRGQRRRTIGAWNALRGKPHDHHGPDEHREGIEGDGARARCLARLEPAEHRIQIRDVGMRHRLVRIERQRALQVRSRLVPVGPQVELELSPQHMDQRQVRLEPFCLAQGSFRRAGCFDRRSVLVDAEPDMRVGQPEVGAGIVGVTG